VPWPGRGLDGAVLYELHVGTFTPEGTFEAIIPHLPGLRSLGVTAIELMPVSEFPGVRGWGYDGVYLMAPHHSYGGPDGLRRLVNEAHGMGMGVMLDLVLNHNGATGVRTKNALRPYINER
jgi:maltooligosyltrehalose trehalohydrolase